MNTPHPRKTANFVEESVEQQVEEVVEKDEEEEEAQCGSYGRHSSNVSFSEDITVVESPSGDGDSDPRSPLQRFAACAFTFLFLFFLTLFCVSTCRVNTPHPRKSANFVEESVV